MQEQVKSAMMQTPILFPIEPSSFWETIRQIVREEVNNQETKKPVSGSFETPGMTYKPLYKIAEVCKLFQVTKPTIYDWVKHGKLKPFKIQSRVYFLWQDIQQLLPVLKNQRNLFNSHFEAGFNLNTRLNSWLRIYLSKH